MENSLTSTFLVPLLKLVFVLEEKRCRMQIYVKYELRKCNVLRNLSRCRMWILLVEESIVELIRSF